MRKVAGLESLRFIRNDRDSLDTFGANGVRDPGDGERAVDRLPAGHRDRVVVKDLEGDVGARRDRLPDRERAGMVESAVAQVLEYVPIAVELRARDPVDAFAAHLDQAFGVPVHPARHEMAADAGERARAFRHFGRRVVRAARAEIRHPARTLDTDGGAAFVEEPVGAFGQPEAAECLVETPCDDSGYLYR